MGFCGGFWGRGRITMAGPPRCGPGMIGSGGQGACWRAGGVGYMLRFGGENEVWRQALFDRPTSSEGTLKGAQHHRLRRAIMVDDERSQFVPQRMTDADAQIGADIHEHRPDWTAADHFGDFAIGRQAGKQGVVILLVRPFGLRLWARRAGCRGGAGAGARRGIEIWRNGVHSIFERGGDAKTAQDAGNDQGHVERAKGAANDAGFFGSGLRPDGGETLAADIDQGADDLEQGGRTRRFRRRRHGG